MSTCLTCTCLTSAADAWPVQHAPLCGAHDALRHSCTLKTLVTRRLASVRPTAPGCEGRPPAPSGHTSLPLLPFTPPPKSVSCSPRTEPHNGFTRRDVARDECSPVVEFLKGREQGWAGGEES